MRLSSFANKVTGLLPKRGGDYISKLIFLKMYKFPLWDRSHKFCVNFPVLPLTVHFHLPITWSYSLGQSGMRDGGWRVLAPALASTHHQTLGSVLSLFGLQFSHP